MGMNAIVLIQATDPPDPAWLNPFFGWTNEPATITPLPDGDSYRDVVPEATHEVSGPDRYFGILEAGAEVTRGKWPRICGGLLALMGHRGVQRVWYGDDYSDTFQVVTPELIEANTRLWLGCDWWGP